MSDSVLHDIVRRAHDLSPSTRTKYLSNVDRWVEFAGSNPSNWTRYKARDFYSHLLASMKPQSANQVFAGLTYASKWWAHYEGNPSLNFATVQTKAPEDQKPQRALTQDQATALLMTCSARTPADIRDLAILTIGLETGMRRMSLLSMRIEAIELEGGSRHPYPAAFVSLKGQPPNWVPLSDTSLMAMTPLLMFHGHDQGGPLFTPLVKKVTRGASIMVPARKPMSESAIAMIFEERGRKAGIPDLHPHQLRHTFITWRAQMGLRPEEIASITHHDITRALGALGGYLDMRAIGGQVRNRTPEWLSDLVASLVRP